jgi:predicted dienelactone hydrolase
LRLTATQRIQRLPESQITEPDFLEYIERPGKRFQFADLCEELNRFVHSQFEHIVDRFTVQLNFEHVRLKAPAFAFGAAYIEVAQKLHLNLFVTRARTALATSAAGIERERACG